MFRPLLAVILIIAFNHNLFAQKKRGQERVDSLLSELPKAKEDTNKAHLLGLITASYSRLDPDKGIEYGEQGLELARKLGWKHGEVDLNIDIANNYNEKSDYHEALQYYTAALTMAEMLDDKSSMAVASLNMANVYTDLGDYVQSLASYMKALHICEELRDTDRIAITTGNIGAYYAVQKNSGKALEWLNKALKLYEQSGDKRSSIGVLNNIGVVYKELGNYDTALLIFSRALKTAEETGSKQSILFATGNIGNVYSKQKKYKEALSCFAKAMTIAEERGDKYSFAIGVKVTGETYLDMVRSPDDKEGYGRVSNMSSGYLQKAIYYLNKAAEMHKSLGTIGELPDTYKNLSEAYKLSGNYKAATESYEQCLLYKDSVFNKENTEKITRLEVEGEYQRKQLADSLKNVETKKFNALKLQKQKTYTYIGAGVVLLLLGFSFFIVKNNKQLTVQKSKLSEEKLKSEELLLNILPEEVSNELKDRGATTAKHFDEVTVLFTDFVNFTGAGERMGTEKLVDELHTCFKAFDDITVKYNIEKIKTIGDAYLAVCGLPVQDPAHAEKVIQAAIEIRKFMQDRKATMGDDTFEIRIGVHSGPVVAGIVGVRKFAYDIWGDTVNTAARMEQRSEASKINISQTTYELVKDKFTCTYRGEIEAKNKGMMKMYFVEGATI
jgi:adenylate cyclase